MVGVETFLADRDTVFTLRTLFIPVLDEVAEFVELLVFETTRFFTLVLEESGLADTIFLAEFDV